MKFLKKIFVLLIATLSLFSICVFTGCNDALSGTMTLVIENPNVEENVVLTVDLSSFKKGDSVFTVLEAYENSGDIYMEVQTGAYGAYITEIGKYGDDGQKIVIIKAQDTATSSIFVSFYTTVESDTAFADTLTYSGVTVGSSSFGASQMSIENGAIIYITEGVYYV